MALKLQGLGFSVRAVFWDSMETAWIGLTKPLHSSGSGASCGRASLGSLSLSDDFRLCQGCNSGFRDAL